jgi:hypothetical protein
MLSILPRIEGATDQQRYVGSLVLRRIDPHKADVHCPLSVISDIC